MMYGIILIVLGALIVTTIIVTIMTIVKEKKEYKHYEMDNAYDMDEDDDDQPPRRAKKSSESKDSGNKRRWKIILENTDSGERHTYVFFDGIGIGRTTKEAAFEEFLSIPYDKKISKIHCAIVGDKDKLYLRDEGSKNHTYLNGKKVKKPIFIQKEDIISIGEMDLEVIKILRETN